MKRFKSFLAISAIAFSFVGSVQAAGEISLYGKGSWISGFEPGINHQHDRDIHSFWLDAKVKNIGYQKDVVMIWTDDAWKTKVESPLIYEHQLGGEYEQWGVDIDPIAAYSSYYVGGWYNYVTGNSTPGKTEIEFYLKYTVNGKVYYDDNNGDNYTHKL